MEAWRIFAADEMVRVVVSGVAPVGVIVDGVKRQTAPVGRPPVQAKVMVEWKPPVGVAASVTGLEVPPRAEVVVAVEGERVKAPTGSRMVKVVAVEVLA